MKNKKFTFIIVVIIVTSLLFSVSSASAATDNISNDKVTEIAIQNGIAKIIENSDMILTKYYENGILLQETVLDKATNDVYLKIITDQKTKESNIKKLNLSSYNYTHKYNTADFITEVEEPIYEPEPVTMRGAVYYQVDTYNYYDEWNDLWSGYLFAADSFRIYTDKVFNFSAGTSVGVIVTVLAYLANPGLWVALVGVVVAGIITTALNIIDKVKEYYWRYKIVQSSPEVCTAYTTYFVYKRARIYILDGDGVEETGENVYYYSASNEAYYQSSTFRDTLMNNIPFYFYY